MTALWSLLIVLFGWFARDNINWMWMISLIIFFQYITDLFDGAVGRYRDAGLIKWGYYMDHLLDYFFIASIITAYSLLFPASFNLLFMGILIVTAGFLVSVYLFYSVSDKMNISFLNCGPTEIRLFLILLNTTLIFLGVDLAQKALLYIFIAEILILFFMVYKTQKTLWKKDMAIKNHTQ
ncbi:MAG: CDP-alcohol phosphatidyltransferase family protein [Patescibacteria group bacterium]